MKTITQIANQNHISRTSVYNRMKLYPDFKKSHMKYIKGKWLVDDSGVKLLSQHRKRAQPKHYNTQNLTKQYFIKRTHQLEQEVAELTHKMASDNRLAKSVKRLANQPKPQQKQLTSGESRPQPELEQDHSYYAVLDAKASNLKNKTDEQAERIKALKKQLRNKSDHPWKNLFHR